MTDWLNLAKLINTSLDESTSLEDLKYVKSAFDDFVLIFGVIEDEEITIDSDIDALIQEREEARQNKDYARADEIRDQLKAEGIVLKDTKDGVKWQRL